MGRGIKNMVWRRLCRGLIVILLVVSNPLEWTWTVKEVEGIDTPESDRREQSVGQITRWGDKVYTDAVDWVENNRGISRKDIFMSEFGGEL